MKIYKLYKRKDRGGIGDWADTTEIGYYTDIDKASTEADKLVKDGEGIVIYYPNKIDRHGWEGLYMNLGGYEVDMPYGYDAYVIEEIEVN